MKIPKLTFEEFLLLPDETREELQHIAFMQSFEVDCQRWTHGQVKDTQELLSTAFTYKDIRDIVSIDIPHVDTIPFHVVLGVFEAIRQSIEQITQIEAESLGGTPTVREAEALQEMGGFDRFYKFPETDALCGGDLTKREQIRALPWDICHVKAMYNKAINDYTKALNNVRPD